MDEFIKTVATTVAAAVIGYYLIKYLNKRDADSNREHLIFAKGRK